MNTYIKTNNSTKFAAVRASRKEVERIGRKDDIVPATNRLRRAAMTGAIPTLRILVDGKLTYL